LGFDYGVAGAGVVVLATVSVEVVSAGVLAGSVAAVSVDVLAVLSVVGVVAGVRSGVGVSATVGEEAGDDGGVVLAATSWFGVEVAAGVGSGFGFGSGVGSGVGLGDDVWFSTGALLHSPEVCMSDPFLMVTQYGFLVAVS
jgi:hypothetical protein